MRGIESERVVLGCAQPGQQTGVFKDALRRLSDHLHYLNSANNRFWFDTRPNLRREMEERKRRFQDKDDVVPAIRERLQQSFATGVFGGIHVFTPSGDVPDDWSLRLVVLEPDAPFSRQEARLWQPTAEALLKRRGDQPRHQQNRLLFLAADYDSVGRLKDQVRSLLAWQSIVTDYRETRIVLDNLMASNAEAALSQAQAAVQRMIRETYKWVLAPMQEARPGKGVSEIQWEHFALTPNAPDLTQEIVRVLKDNELLITDWAPIHLANMLKTWFWKPDVQEVSALDVWQKTCQYLYLPRLRDDAVFRAALAAGTGSRDFFGMAYGKDDTAYVGFSFGQAVSPVLDSTLLVIEPHTASAYAEAQRAAAEAATPTASSSTGPTGTGRVASGIPIRESLPTRTAGGLATPVKRHFYGKIDLDPIMAKMQFADLVDEVVLQFTSRPGVQVKLRSRFRRSPRQVLTRSCNATVKENCNVLHFQNAEFEEGE